MFVCPTCKAVSYNQNDVANRYCGKCHSFADDEGHTYSLGGEFLILEEDRATGTSGIRFDDKGLGRTCGSCSLCCKLLPIGREDVAGFQKPAGQRCQHQRTSGEGCCTIHDQRPFPCRTWSCRWMADPKARNLPRPDRCHYVVDSVVDYVTAVTDDGKSNEVSVLQVWVDPDFPDAHRDPKLRAYLLMMAQEFRCAALIRYDESRAFMLVPPPMTNDGKWLERSDTGVTTVAPDHPFRQRKPPKATVVLRQ